ncbi:MAG TPA: hypothetical protein VG738_19140 [Chitinophagaceae bacterium]|nr:hypothetical protein [Chitinophagaceae bacterium]
MTATVGALATAPHKFAKKWFVYSGTGDPGLNSNYSLAPSNGADPGCPTPPTTVCAVQADPSSGNSNRPDQTELTTIDGASSGFTTSAANLEYHSR